MFWWLDPLIAYTRFYVTKFKKTILYAAVAAALFVGGYATGWTHSNLRHAEAESRRAETAVRTVVKEVVKRDEVERIVYVRDLETIRKLEADRDRLRAENIELQERVSLYVPENFGPGGGYLSVGLVRLLDHATSGHPGAASPPAASPSEADFAPSAVGWDDFTRHYVLISGRYNDVMMQCNALIDWVELNVVNKPAS